MTNVNAVANWLRVPSPQPISVSEQQVIQNCITAASSYWIWKLFGTMAVQLTQSPLCEAVSFTEVRDGNGKTRLWTRYRPVQSVQLLQVDDTTFPLSTAWNQAGYVIDGNGYSIQLRATGNWPIGWQWGRICFRPGVANVNLQYTAGYPSIAIVNELQTIPAVGPYALNTLKAAIADGRIRYFVGGASLTPVTVAPAAGQYFISDIGQYQFAAADTGAQVLIDYTAPGTPPDIQIAATQMVAVNYKRREWIDQSSQSGGGNIQFRDWELPPEVCSVMNYYSRTALLD